MNEIAVKVTFKDMSQLATLMGKLDALLMCELLPGAQTDKLIEDIHFSYTKLIYNPINEQFFKELSE